MGKDNQTCPDCGGPAVWREPKPGQRWTAFWGCANYAACPGNPKHQPLCPEHHVRVGRRGCPWCLRGGPFGGLDDDELLRWALDPNY